MILDTQGAASVAARAVLVTLLALAAAGTRAPAQQPAGQAAQRPALLALVTELNPASARAQVVRRGGAQPEDVIVLRETATADDLATAISWLLDSRARRGDDFPNIMRVTISSASSDTPLAPGLRRALDEALDRARRGEARTVPTIGASHAATLSLERFRKG